jgi:hypothetical protein
MRIGVQRKLKVRTKVPIAEKQSTSPSLDLQVEEV